MTRLDNREHIERNDPDGMLGHIMSFGDHLRTAGRTAGGALAGMSIERPAAVVVAGMGGSAIAGDLIRGALADLLSVPMSVARGYVLPAFVKRDTLVVASSYSGNTEETLSAHADAVARGARVVCMTTGGRLAELADARGEPVVPLAAGLPPRAALGHGLASLLSVLAAAGLTADPSDELASMASAADSAAARFAPEVPSDSNGAKGLAVWLDTGVPVVYGAEPHTAAVATRWVGQLAENAKTVGHANVLPEMNHNEIVGYGDRRALGGMQRVVFLRDADDHERIARRIAITADVLSEEGVESREVRSFGDTRLGRLVSLVLAGDYVSVYLAALRGIDPTPVEPIDRLKRALSE
ncbi:MAG: bifunctional phosphoglucose/phosphomannose isomerase [Candidatus Eisenbacteria bacterium]|nr:bifunctional phosphoglucose/phosphomannose isomerase [Candidatus Eisenbacteria bacterium]